MSIASFVLSSLFTLVVLMDTNPTATSCINSTIVKKVTVEGSGGPEQRGFDWFKEKWVGNCGPLKSNSMDNFERIQSWFSSRELKTDAVEIIYRDDKNFVVAPEVISLPLANSGDLNVISRLLTKALFLQNKIPVEGVAGEIATDLVLSDLFGNEFVRKLWKIEGTDLFGEFSNLKGDCEKGFVPREKDLVLCGSQMMASTMLSKWALRWLAALEFDENRRRSEIQKSVEVSKTLFETIKAISEDKSIDEPILGLNDLEKRAKNLISKLGSTSENYHGWAKNSAKVQILIAETYQGIHLEPPLPKNTLILSFESGFHFLNGDLVELPEGEVFQRARRVAFVGCESPTVADVLQYSGIDARLLYIQSCKGQKLKLELFEKFGASGVQYQNPNVRFLQFHKPSTKIALDWGLKSTSSFGFTRIEASTPERFRRLFGWKNADSMKAITAPIPIVEIFNSRKGEIPSLRGWIQSGQNEARDTSRLDREEEDSEEQTKKIF